MKSLVIGFGSIGKRHSSLLKNHLGHDVTVVSKQTQLDYPVYSSLQKVPHIDQYDYYIIATETHLHFEQLSFLNNAVRDKFILVEKPLFMTPNSIKNNQNHIFVGYNLRFHPLLMYLKNVLSTEKILCMDVVAGYYLPEWRKTDYRQSYSAESEKGGGVLYDLSHEIDYLQWISGEIVQTHSIQAYHSDLEIKADDITIAIGKTTKNVLFMLHIDYISKIKIRTCLVHTNKATYWADLIQGTLRKKHRGLPEEVLSWDQQEKNATYLAMHTSILKQEKNACTFDEGIKTLETIQKMQSHDGDPLS